MILKYVTAFLNQYMQEHPEHADLEVKFGFYPTDIEYEEPSLEIEEVKYLKIKIKTPFRHQIKHDRITEQAQKKLNEEKRIYPKTSR